MSTKIRLLRVALCAASVLTALPAHADAPTPTLEEQFRDPPQSARPRVWWHWMNGNITKDGIAKDLAWMKSVGIGGVHNFDVNLMTPQIVQKRLAYMTPNGRTPSALPRARPTGWGWNWRLPPHRAGRKRAGHGSSPRMA
jgi:hypothetical protein